MLGRHLVAVALVCATSLVGAAHSAAPEGGATATPPTPAAAPEAPGARRDAPARFGDAVSAKVDELAEKIAAVELRSASSDAVFGLLGASFGALVGAGISLLVLWRTNRFARLRDEQAEQLRQQAVRTLVKAEIDLNLQMLRDEAALIDLDNRPDDMSGIEWVASQPCPEWSTVAFMQTVGQFHAALTDAQIRSVQAFYGSLRSYSTARANLSAVFARPQSYKYVSVPYDKADAMLAELLRTRNPLA